MINKIKEIYIKEQFNPTIVGLIINPFYFARKNLYNNIKKLIVNLQGRLLDVGCGSQPYKSLCRVEQYIALEVRINKKNNPTVWYDGYSFPFKDKTFDSVLITQVLEHVFLPELFLKEINRITKLQGKILLTIPFVWDEHEQPFDYARYTLYGIKYLLSNSGFKILDNTKSCNNTALIFQLINCYIYKKIYTQNKYFNLIVNLLFIFPINLLGLILSKILPKNNDLYLDNIILAYKVSDV